VVSIAETLSCYCCGSVDGAAVHLSFKYFGWHLRRTVQSGEHLVWMIFSCSLILVGVGAESTQTGPEGHGGTLASELQIT
jgi:hypothetical protein